LLFAFDLISLTHSRVWVVRGCCSTRVSLIRELSVSLSFQAISACSLQPSRSTLVKLTPQKYESDECVHTPTVRIPMEQSPMVCLSYAIKKSAVSSKSPARQVNGQIRQHGERTGSTFSVCTHRLNKIGAGEFWKSWKKAKDLVKGIGEIFLKQRYNACREKEKEGTMRLSSFARQKTGSRCRVYPFVNFLSRRMS
jgi:hypothetical protein